MANATLGAIFTAGLPVFPTMTSKDSILTTLDTTHLGSFLSSNGLTSPDTPFFNFFYDNVAALSLLFGGGALGDWAAYCLLTIFPFKIFRTLGILFFLKADKEGWLDRYRIQEKGKQPSDAETAKMYQTQVSNWFIGFLIVELPMTTAFYFLRQFLTGYSIHTRDPGGWLQLAWKFYVALIVYDVWVWAWHVACHKSPYMYQRFHNQHHEHTSPNILSSAYFEFVDLLFETSLGVYAANLAADSTFLGGLTWMCFMSWIGCHNHSGFRCPWDLVNAVLGYVDNHDAHHEYFNVNYQTVFQFADKLFGWAIPRKEVLGGMKDVAGKGKGKKSK